MTRTVFFLGGGDAEMSEIRSVLQARNLPFHDRRLRWGARLSEYADELARLPPGSAAVLVELEPDIDPPPGAILIDHHGARAGRDRPTSLEQVAELLGVSLDRRQRLVAANDRGHIRAMEAMGATAEEIAGIRAADRKAQGVNSGDEEAARWSIRFRLRETAPGTALVDSRTDRTSPVADRLFDRYARIFVRTPDGATHFFGDGSTIRRLRRLCDARDPPPPRWFGGELPHRGFFGAQTRLTDEEIERMSQTAPVSHHIFMFPFTLKAADRGETDDEATMDRVQEALGPEWEVSRFRREDIPSENSAALDEAELRLRYSEDVYFHPFARPAIFGEPGGEEGTTLMRYFTFRPGAGGRFRIFVRKWGETEPDLYDLEIEDIALRIYDTDVGILSLELGNWDHPELSDILRINDFGRRIYPQFLGKDGIDATKGAFLPDRVEMILERSGDEPERVEEPFAEADFRKSHRCVARYIRRLLGERFATDPEALAAGKARYRIRPTIDDRMFAICWYGSNSWAESLKAEDEEARFAYETSPDWYRFVFVDGGEATCGHPEMLRRLIRETTYERWARCGTLFGISRYSLVAITDRSFMGAQVIREHMRRQYAQMAGLLLAQRASILRFSDTVSEISGKIRAAGGPAKRTKPELEFQRLAEQLERLQGDYIRFVNRLWFTEITPQEQGMEMYDQAVRVMRLKEHMADLKAEIKDLYEYVAIRRDRDDNRQINQLTILGAIFLPLTLLAGFFGMNLVFIEEPLWPIVLGWVNAVHSGFGEFLARTRAFPRGVSFVFFLGSIGLIFVFARRVLRNIAGGDPRVANFLGCYSLLKAVLLSPESARKRKKKA